MTFELATSGVTDCEFDVVQIHPRSRGTRVDPAVALRDEMVWAEGRKQTVKKMISTRLLAISALVMSFGSPEGHAQEVFPVPIFVMQLETQPLPPLKPEAHQAEIKSTRAQMFVVAEGLRKQHGDKTSAWPPEVWQLFYAAEDASTLAVARRDYQPAETRLGLADSVADFVRGAGVNKSITMVTSADEASLVVQITGRRRAEASGPTDNRYFIRFRLVPGAKMTAARFLDLTRDYKWNNAWTTQIAHANDASGFVELEGGSMASFKNCAGMVRAIVDGFIRARLDPARKK